MEDDQEPDDQYEFVVLAQLAAHPPPFENRPTHDDVDMGPVIEAAFRTVNLRSSGELADTSMLVRPLGSADPWKEIFSLWGSIGESLMLAATCEIEVEWLRRQRADDPDYGTGIIGQRFISQAEAQEVVSIGHRLFNLVLRALTIEPELRTDLLSARGPVQKWATKFQPWSEDRSAWLSFTATSVRMLAAVTSSSVHPSIRRLGPLLSDLHDSGEWTRLEELRGRDFHRHRPESSLVAGVDPSSGFVRPITNYKGTVVGSAFGANRERYSLGDGAEEAVAGIAADALRKVAKVANDVADVMVAALEPLSNGHLVPSGGKAEISFRIGHRWSPEDCGCCSA